MAKIQEFETNQVIGAIQNTEMVNMTFLKKIFGDPYAGRLAKTDTLTLKVHTNKIEKPAQYGDFWANPVVVKTEDAMSEITFRVPAVHELAGITADDPFVREVDQIMENKKIDPATRRILEQMLDKIQPISILIRRQQQLMKLQAAELFRTGKLVFHNGYSFDSGLSAQIEVLPAGQKWDDTGVDIFEQIDDIVYAMANDIEDAYVPGAIYLDRKAAKLFRSQARGSSDVNGKPANFIFNDGKKYSTDSSVTYLGQIIQNGIEVYQVSDKYKDRDGTVKDVLDDNTAIFVPRRDPMTEGYVWGSIPYAEFAPGNRINVGYRPQRNRFYNIINDAGTIGSIGILYGVTPVILKPKGFKILRVA